MSEGGIMTGPFPQKLPHDAIGREEFEARNRLGQNPKKHKTSQFNSFLETFRQIQC
jgi:hypothetical protein